MTDPKTQDQAAPSDMPAEQEKVTEDAQREAAEEREEEGGYQ